MQRSLSAISSLSVQGEVDDDAKMIEEEEEETNLNCDAEIADSPKRTHVDPNFSPRKSCVEFEMFTNDGDRGMKIKIPEDRLQSSNTLFHEEGEAPTKLQLQETQNFRRAVFEGNLVGVQSIANECSNIKRLVNLTNPKDGFTPLMIAVSGEQDNTHELVAGLLALGADTDTIDHKGNTALHWAAHHGQHMVLPDILKGLEDLERANNQGDTPLHLASRAGHERCFNILLDYLVATAAIPASVVSTSTISEPSHAPDIHESRIEDKKETLATLVNQSQNSDGVHAILVIRNFENETCFDVAGTEVITDENATVKYELQPEIRKRICGMITSRFPYFRTLVLHHPDCFDHVPVGEGVNKDVWEAPERLHAILRSLSKKIDSSGVVTSTEFRAAGRDMLIRGHSEKYVDLVQDLSESITKAVPFTPRIQEGLCKLSQVKKAAESDTSFSMGSLQAAKRACGGVCHAIDKVVESNHRNAFCLVRPPGHHAGIDGLLESATSCGFCIFNNVALGALHALEKHSSTVKKVAIVDIDVHHGNGTEEIVAKYNREHMQKGEPPIMFFSSHVFDAGINSQQYQFYPGSGQHSDLLGNILNAPMQPLWRRRNKKHAKNKFAERFYSDHFGRTEFRRVVKERLLPPLRAFNPDLILVSAGFDAGFKDVGNGRYIARGYQSGFDLKPQDFAWVSAQVSHIANLCCKGRVVSVLEGGYGKLSDENKSKIDRSSLVNNCLAHLAGLVDVCVQVESTEEAGDEEEEEGLDLEDEQKGRSTRQRKKPQRFEAGAKEKRRNSQSSSDESSVAESLSGKRQRHGESKAQLELLAMKEDRRRNALHYLAKVKLAFAAKPTAYNDFLVLMASLKKNSVESGAAMVQIKKIFAEEKRLLIEFGQFLPPGVKLDSPDSSEVAAN